MAAPSAASSALLKSEFIMELPTTNSVVCLDPISLAPAAVITQAMFDIMDSNGSTVLASMSVQLDKPEGADMVVTGEDEQLLAGSSMERPLAFVAATDMADDDHSLVAGTSAMLLTLATLTVNNGQVANKREVLLPLKLLVRMSESKEPYVLHLLLQFIQAMVSGVTSLNQLHTKYNGMCFDLGCATTPSSCLLPWDPGKKTGISRDPVLSRDIA
jgi:hypothetical protein